jgi:uncharacterized protein YyaL (SSP411 family)
MADLMGRHPTGFGRYLGALDFHLGPTAEVALVWPASSDQASAAPLLQEVFGRYLPSKIVAGAPEGAPTTSGIPLLAERRAMDGKPTAYLCRRYVCQLPVTTSDDFARQLEAGV